MEVSTTAEPKHATPEGGTLVIASGFCAACDSHFVDAAAYRFDAVDGTVLIEARHYVGSAASSASAP